MLPCKTCLKYPVCKNKTFVETLKGCSDIVDYITLGQCKDMLDYRTNQNVFDWKKKERQEKSKRMVEFSDYLQHTR